MFINYQVGQAVGGAVNGIGNSINGVFGGNSGSSGYGQEDDGLLGAVAPVAVTSVLVLALSTIFANQVSINSTSNGTLPLLFQLPELRFKRDVNENGT